VHISYDVTGVGPGVLLSHGFMATSHMWQPNVPALATDHTVVTWDLRGHGSSDSPDSQDAYSPQIATADMAAVLDAAGLERAVIVGMSLGGYLSLLFRLEYPERCSGIVLVDCGPGFKRDDARAQWNELAESRAHMFENGGLEALDRTRTEIKDAPHRDAAGLARAARGILAQRNAAVINSLPEIDVPALVVVGDRDERFIPGSQYMASKIPGADLFVVPDAGHASNMDQPDAFNDRLREFLAGHGI
jgi:pimeloyl-ACP methyl ester carboxylesterase